MEKPENKEVKHHKKRNHDNRNHGHHENRNRNRNQTRVEVEPIPNPYAAMKLYEKDEITLDTEVPKLPEKPHLLTEDMKNAKIDDINTKIIELKNEKEVLNNQMHEINAKLRRQKPAHIVEAEKKRKEQLDIKKKHMDELLALKITKKDIRDKMSSFDDQKPDKMKKAGSSGSNMPKDEDELNKQVEYWENVLQTKSLKAKEEEDIFKKLNSLEMLRKSISDYSNISTEVLNLKKQLQQVNDKIAVEKKAMDKIAALVKEADDAINPYYDSHKDSTEGERKEQDKIRKRLEETDKAADALHDEKNRIFAEFRAAKEVLDSYTKVKRNVEYVKRVKESLERREEERKEKEDEEKKRKANQMSDYEVNITYANQLKATLEPLLESKQKKLSLGLETIQIFSKIKLGSFPSKKNDIPATLKLVDEYIIEQQKLHEEYILTLKDE